MSNLLSSVNTLGLVAHSFKPKEASRRFSTELASYGWSGHCREPESWNQEVLPSILIGPIIGIIISTHHCDHPFSLQSCVPVSQIYSIFVQGEGGVCP